MNLDFLPEATRETIKEHLSKLQVLSEESPIDRDSVLAVHSKITDLLAGVKNIRWTPEVGTTDPVKAVQALEKYTESLYRLAHIEGSFVSDCEILLEEPSSKHPSTNEQNIISKEQVRPNLAACLDKLRADCSKVLTGNVLEDHQKLLFLLKQIRCYHDIMFRREAFAKRSKAVRLQVIFEPSDSVESMTQKVMNTNIENLPSQQFGSDIEKTCLLVEGLAIVQAAPDIDDKQV
jgi:hypothetical protein